MYDFSKEFSNGLTKEWIFARISDWDIFSYYHGPFKLGKVYKSVLRQDANPSCGFYVNKTGNLIYNDIAQQKKYNCFQFVMAMYGDNYNACLKRIGADFGLLEGQVNKVSKKVLEASESAKNSQKGASLVQVVYGQWEKQHLDYWRLYEVSKVELEENAVFPVKRLYINKNVIRDNSMRFAYPLKWADGEGVKVYAPYSKDLKWFSSIPNCKPFGLDDLNYDSDTIYITKSKKDLICLKKIFPSVIGLQNESEGAFPVELQEELKEKFKNRIVWFDNDPPGVTSCKLFNDKGFGYFNIPKEDYVKYNCKDPSDYIRYFGLDALKELLTKKGLL